MIPRERWLAVLKGDKPDRIPMDWWATAEVEQMMIEHLHCESLEQVFEKLHVDKPFAVKPKYVGPKFAENTTVFGIPFRKVDYGQGAYYECADHPLAEYETVEEIKRNYTWPCPDWWDYSEIGADIQGKEDVPIQAGGSEPFLTYKDLRGDEQAFMDLILRPEIVHYCVDRLFELSYQNTLRIFEQIPGKVVLSYVAEDFGTQDDLMYSPEQIREFFVPGMKRMIELVHSSGAYVFHHSDGAVRKIIPDMIEAGIDVLNPIQWRCKGMGREGLTRDFGDRLVFHGGVDNQYTLAFGSEEEVRAEVRDNIRILGKEGRYIIAPCHNIQPVSPPENILEMYETGYKYGEYK